MNQLQLEQKLRKLVRESNQSYLLLNTVCNAIVHYYCATTDFYEEDAIEVFQYFLKTQVLDLKMHSRR